MAEDTGHHAAACAAPAGIDAARLNLRRAGYCLFCDQIRELGPEGGCVGGHPPEVVTCCAFLDPGDEVPQLPRFNWGAFLMPPIWGAGNGAWWGFILLPVWVFADNALQAGLRAGGAALVGGLAVAIATVGFQAWFGRRGFGVAWRRVCGRTSFERFLGQQRAWAWAGAAFWLLVGAAYATAALG